MSDENGSFSEDTFKENLQNSYFPDKIPGKSGETYKRYVEDMFDILKYNMMIIKIKTKLHQQVLLAMFVHMT